MTRVIVCVGAGGVGKTTISAAIAEALSSAGDATLVATTDPARRLADVLGIAAAPTIVTSPRRPGLDVYMPDASAGARATAARLLAHDPARLARLENNQVFRALCDGLAGVHELAALAGLAGLGGRYDSLVLDTAPSRHALDLLELPGKLEVLVEGPSLRWLGELARGARAPARGLRRMVGWGTRRLLTWFETVLGAGPLGDALEVLAVLSEAQPELLRIARASKALLTGASTEYVVIVAARADALRDVRFFDRELARIARPPSHVLINRVPTGAPAWATALALMDEAPTSLREAAELAIQGTVQALAATRAIEEELAGGPVVTRIPAVEASEDTELVPLLAEELRSVFGCYAPRSQPLRNVSG
jgi:anion-transporting  ArsA/GET3 family ATPase